MNMQETKRTKKPFMLVLEQGNELIGSIKKIAEKINLSGATVMGIGAITNAKIGYYSLETKEYEWKIFSEVYELVSLNGNISKYNDEYVVHLHVALGDQNHNIIGGHLSEAIVAVTAEITIIPFNFDITRQHSPKFNLNLISRAE